MFRALFRVFDYSGRSTRWEYWSFFIGCAIVGGIAGIAYGAYIDSHAGAAPYIRETDLGIASLALIAFVILPATALKVRRFHDFEWSGWSILLTVVPVVNIFIELMLLFRGPVIAAFSHEPQHINIYNSPGTVAAEASNASSVDVDGIARLADLHTRGMLTAEEFAAAKSKVLGQ